MESDSTQRMSVVAMNHNAKSRSEGPHQDQEVRGLFSNQVFFIMIIIMYLLFVYFYKKVDSCFRQPSGGILSPWWLYGLPPCCQIANPCSENEDLFQ